MLKILSAMFALVVACGCRSTTADVERAASADLQVRNNAAGLLYALLGDEQHVSKLLLIKRERTELHRVIKNISESADDARKALERLAKQDATLDLKRTDLPAGEKAAREAESKARSKELLGASGADFEFKLLLSQAEAIGYARRLALVAAGNEPEAEHARVFSIISRRMDELHGEVLRLLRSPPAR